MRTNTLSRRALIAQVAAVTLAVTTTATSAQQPNSYTFAFLGLDTCANDANQRSDAIMLSRVNFDTSIVRTLSIPRDLYVEIPGYGFGKINDAYQRGLAAESELTWQSGAATAVATFAHNFGVDFDDTFVLELQRLPDVIDAVGGGEVNNPYQVYVDGFPNYSGGGTRTLDFPAGLITLDGADTMDYVRTRQQDDDGGRVMRQHLVLTALLERLKQPEFHARIPSLIEQLSNIVHTDINVETQLKLIAAIPPISKESLAFTNIEELLWSGYTAEGAWIYQADWSTPPDYVRSWRASEID